MKLYRELEPGEPESKSDLILNHHSFPNHGHGNWKVFRPVAAGDLRKVTLAERDEAYMEAVSRAEKAEAREKDSLKNVEDIIARAKRAEAQLKTLYDSLDEDDLGKHQRALKAIDRACGKCGHDTTTDGCPFCLRAACAKKNEALRDAKDILTMEKQQGRFEFDPMIIKLQNALADDCGKELLAELERLREGESEMVDDRDRQIEKLKDNADHWIARSQREPGAEDFLPSGYIHVWGPKEIVGELIGASNWDDNVRLRYGEFAVTHWRKITPPQEENK